ncbi:MAG: transcription antitermination factor NusB [Armatimonadota bacterium]|nr:transcription antitermination factor NusB [Armatimonadota bacterium]MDR5697240.1 transcription antitermination factor NusB [Armatimonadota bacterium]
MSSRRMAREAVLRILFQAEVGGLPLEQVVASYADGWPDEDDRVVKKGWDDDDWRFIVRLSRGAWEGRSETDALIARYAEGWTLERMPRVDVCVLRMAVYELLHTDTPPSVVINEAVELAKRYSTEESGRFVNGILGRIYREHVEREERVVGG